MQTKHWFTSSSGKIELQLTIEQAKLGSHKGQCDYDINELLTVPEIVVQLDKYSPELIANELYEYGAWSTSDLQDIAQNRARLLWIACGDIVENA